MQALYVHYHAHCLNLVLVESAKSNKHFIEKLYTFIANSPKRHAVFVETQRAIDPDQCVLELQRLSDTRWSCREDALKTIRKVIPAVLHNSSLSQDVVKPKPGDLIEIFRVGYQHWAIYVGDGCIIHLVPASESTDHAIVKMDNLRHVVGTSKFRINNLLDDVYEPRSVGEILKDAWSWVGQELPYCVFRGNCEHFVTELRYGKPESRQVGVLFSGISRHLYTQITRSQRRSRCK
uniref:Retinoic acid receptor responder protein 3-like n=1 Tax=Paramormyrops kingsleyae TaxID=1676925 RepID=A0A3B3Q1L7_9TELE